MHQPRIMCNKQAATCNQGHSLRQVGLSSQVHGRISHALTDSKPESTVRGSPENQYFCPADLLDPIPYSGKPIGEPLLGRPISCTRIDPDEGIGFSDPESIQEALRLFCLLFS